MDDERSRRQHAAVALRAGFALAAVLVAAPLAATATTTTTIPADATTTTTLAPTTTLDLATTTTTLAPEPPAPVFRRCGDPSGDGAVKAGDALLVLRSAIGTYNGCHALTCDASGRIDGIKASDALAVLRAAVGTTPVALLRCPSPARLWNERLLAAIRLDLPRPTVHARNLFHLSVAAWDAWVAWDDGGATVPYLVAETPPALPDAWSARTTATSYAAYRLLSHRFANAFGHAATQAALDAEMQGLGLDPAFVSTDGDSAAAFGNRIGAALIAHGLADASNESANYDDGSYEPVNAPLYPALSGAEMVDPNRWQPLSLEFSVTQNGIPLPISVQDFICPHWAGVEAFATPMEAAPAPPLLGGEGDAEYRASAVEVLRLSSRLDPADGATMDLSPGVRGNNPLGTNDGTGHAVNPATGQPYAPQVVKRADWARVLAEYWADGPRSETPPGHWNVIANQVADDARFERRLGGEGDVLDAFDWDVRAYLALNGAVHDAAVSAWGNKGLYDSARPISMIRYMAGLGQSSDPEGPAYHADGIPLEEGLVEIVTAESSAPGQRHEHLAEHVGKVAVLAWRGNPEHPAEETGGVGWILGVDWVPYQKDTFVTPAFAGYYSGHSTFSRAAAEVMTGLTGSAFFPGGLGEFRASANQYLTFERGPEGDVALQWATYQDAADEAGLSRLYGGIHIRADDFAGRVRGYELGRAALEKAATYWGAPAAP